MPLFMKKQHVIEAVQIKDDNYEELLDFCGDKIKFHKLVGTMIETRNGKIDVKKGDWLIRDIDGDIEYMNQIEFDRIYEQVYY